MITPMMPTQIPALKISPITSQEVKTNGSTSNHSSGIIFSFFIPLFIQKSCLMVAGLHTASKTCLSAGVQVLVKKIVTTDSGFGEKRKLLFQRRRLV